MRLITGDLFGHNKNGPAAICITTKGAMDRSGRNVMGAGCARAARGKWPGIETIIGTAIEREGNVPHLLTGRFPAEVPGEARTLQLPSGSVEVPYHIVTFPVKPPTCDESQLLTQYQNHLPRQSNKFPGWMACASLELIEHSARTISAMADEYRWKSVIIPRPGCGAGGLDFDSEVKPLLASLLDERFYIITF